MSDDNVSVFIQQIAFSLVAKVLEPIESLSILFSIRQYQYQ